MSEESRLDSVLTGRMESRILTDNERSELLVRTTAAIFVWPGTGETEQDLLADPTMGLIVGTTEAADQMFGFQEGQLLLKPIEILIPERFRSMHRKHFASFVLHPVPRQMGSRLDGQGLYGLHQIDGEFPLEIGLTQKMTKSGRQKCIIALPARARNKPDGHQKH